MKYFARIGQNEYVVEINDEQISVDGELIEVDLIQGGAPELYSMLFNGHSHELLIETERFNYGVTLRSEHFGVQVEDERIRKLNAGRKPPSLPHGDLAVTAPIPGLVVKVMCDEGDTIEEGQSLVILEAMKMENEIRALRTGTIKLIGVTEGQRVEQNEILVVLE